MVSAFCHTQTCIIICINWSECQLNMIRFNISPPCVGKPFCLTTECTIIEWELKKLRAIRYLTIIGGFCWKLPTIALLSLYTHMYAQSYMVYVAMIEWIRWSYVGQNGGEEFLRPTLTNLGFNLKAYYVKYMLMILNFPLSPGWNK